MGSFKEWGERREKGMGGREREAENYSWLNVSLKQRTRLLFIKESRQTGLSLGVG